MVVLKRKIDKDYGWSPERRAAQSARMRARQIWLKSTGPRTAEGKARVAANGLKDGHYTRAQMDALRQVRQALRAQRDFMADVAAFDRLSPCDKGWATLYALLRDRAVCVNDALLACLPPITTDRDGFLGKKPYTH